MKKPLTIFYLLFFLCLCLSFDATAQRNKRKKANQRFKAGVVVGFNVAQIDGDNYAGYDKLGLQTGLRGIAVLGKKTELAVEMLFVQKGSKNKDQMVSFKTARSISFNYIEVPLLLRYKFSTKPTGYSVESGFSFGRLLGYNIVENPQSVTYIPFTGLTDDFNRNEISYLIGFSANVTEQIRLTVRSSFAMSLLYERGFVEPKPSTSPPTFWGTGIQSADISHLRNYFASLSATYVF